jgi:hypothetical protein
METVIYVELEEGSSTPVFAPVSAIHLGKNFYKIIEHQRKDYDALRFSTGTYVVCLLSQLSVSKNLIPVAYCEIEEAAVKYILSESA